MTTYAESKPGDWSTRLLASFAALAIAIALSSGPARAQAGDAHRILKTMSEFVAKHQNIAIVFNSDIEVVTQDFQKLQFASSGTVLMSRPDKIRATRSGGYSQSEVVFDGNVAAILNTDANVYMRLEAPGSIDQLLEKLRLGYGVMAPGADLLVANVFDDLMEGVIEARHIGPGVIDGVECEHLAFRTPEADWQIWIETGARPIPRKYVITSKSVTAAPQYTLRVRDWRSDPQINADSFTFTAPQAAKQVAVNAFPKADEVPDGTVSGGK